MNRAILYIAGISAILAGTAGYIVGGIKARSVDSAAVAQTVTMDMNMSGMHGTGKGTGLEGKQGDALDIAFLEGMVAHHQNAVDMSKAIVEKTKRPELKQFAEQIISAQSKEIETMQDWLTQWYGR